MPEENCNADELANDLFTSLTADAPTPPVVDLTGDQYSFDTSDSTLYEDVDQITLEQLTEVDLEGEGVFDKLMKAVDIHVQREYKNNRITGDQYAEVYTAVVTAVLGQATSFLLQKDQAKWNAIQAQMQARIVEIQATEALIGLEKTKVETQKAIFEMQNSGAQYALTKMEIANADANHCLIKAKTSTEEYTRQAVLPADVDIKKYTRSNTQVMEYRKAQIEADRILPAEAGLKEFDYRILKPIEKDIQEFQRDQTLPLQQAAAQYNFDNMLPVMLGKEQHILNFQLPAQTALINEQKEVQRSQTLDNRSDALTPISGLVGTQRQLIAEQVESERAKTMDTRTDGSTLVEGSIGKQIDLYNQQIDSFIKDSKTKVTKMYLDGWITQKTLDENLLAPSELGVSSVSDILAELRSENDMT